MSEKNRFIRLGYTTISTENIKYINCTEEKNSIVVVFNDGSQVNQPCDCKELRDKEYKKIIDYLHAEDKDFIIQRLEWIRNWIMNTDYSIEELRKSINKFMKTKKNTRA